MSALVATVNGKKVFSDKEIDSIVNTRITFSDSSWCDVTTGAVVNNGPGFISIGAPNSEASGEKVTSSKSFTASSLEVRNLNADLNILVREGKEISVEIEGPKTIIEAIDVHQSGNSVVVKGKSGGSAGVQIRGDNVSVVSGMIGYFGFGNPRNGSNVVIYSNSENVIKVTIYVPKETPIVASDINGKTVIGDIEGSLQIDSRGSGEFFVGSVSNTSINIQGSSEVTINQVTGNLSTKVQGSGEIKVKKGSVNLLQVNISGSGDFYFGGQAINANLKISGSGDVEIYYVENKPVVKVSGSGDINVGNW